MARILHDDETLARVIQDSASMQDAADRLGISKTCARRHADRLGIRSRFRYGVEKLPPDDELARLITRAAYGKGLSELARQLGVTRALLTAKSRELGVDGRRFVHDGIPDDETLDRDLVNCQSYSELAERYGVPVHRIRNEAKRLGIISPTKRAVYGLVAARPMAPYGPPLKEMLTWPRWELPEGF